MTAGGRRHPRACGSVVLKARERKRRLQVSIRMPFSCGICCAGRGWVVLSKVVL